MSTYARIKKADNLFARPRTLASGERVVYWAYRHPRTGKEKLFGRDLKEANQAANILNSKLAADPVLEMVATVETKRDQLKNLLKWWTETYLPSRRSKRGEGLSDASMEHYKRRAAKLSDRFGSRYVDDIETRELVAFFDEHTAEIGNRFRSDCQRIFTLAVSRGLRKDNPALVTMKKDVVVQRQRLTLEAYNHLHANAPAWLARAMQLQLRSLQRPSDLCALKRERWAPDGRVLTVRQSKVAKHGLGRLRITATGALLAAIEDCYANQVMDEREGDHSPHLIGYVPEKRKKAKGREHWAQLSDEILSRAFAELRDKLAADEATPPAIRATLAPADGTPPTFYECKSLGTHLYEKEGWPEERIQALAGHADKKTTRIYTDRHEEKWAEVEG